jgi:ribosomal 50S subunit-recycling heat shock protein
LRVDLYLKLMGITKTRMAAKHLCDAGKVLVNGKAAKPSHEILVGDSLGLFLPQKEMKLKVLEVPSSKSVAKQDRPQFMVLEITKEL